METNTTTRPLAVESFSDSWLSNTRLSLINVLDETTTTTTTNSFDFDTPIKISDKSPVNYFVHADELFCNGLIKPSFVNSGLRVSSTSSTRDSTISALSSLSDSRSAGGVTDQDVQVGCSCCFFRSRQRRLLSQRVLQKLFGYRIRTTWRRKVGGSKKSTKVDDIDRRTLEVKSLSNCSSPGPSTVNDDIESSIYEAVLHCKRSIGK